MDTTNTNTNLRKIELEKKREKLAELRRSREFRKSQHDIASSVVSAVVSSSSSTAAAVVSRRPQSDLDSLVDSLLSTNPTPPPPPPPTTTTTTTTALPLPPPNTSSQSSLLPVVPESQIPPQTSFSLQPADTLLFELLPSERVVVYSKEIQTDFQPTLDEPIPLPLSPNSLPTKPPTPPPPPPPLPGKEENVDLPIPELSNDELSVILTSTHFISFVKDSARVMQKALAVSEKFDFLRDYKVFADSTDSINETESQPVSLNQSFYHNTLAKSRTVTSICWNPKFPELFAVAYTKPITASTHPDGLVIIWNVLVSTEAEFVLTCQSEVRTLTISKLSSTVIVGGTYSGQIHIWDTRTNQSTPILRTSVSALGHTHPITTCKIILPNHVIQTCATNGTVCLWQMDMLASPQSLMQVPSLLSTSSHATTSPATSASTSDPGVTCLELINSPSTTNVFLLGTEHGLIVHVSFTQEVPKIVARYTGHFAFITSIHAHPTLDLFLSTSMDWRVNLYHHHHQQQLMATDHHQSSQQNHHHLQPLCTFQDFSDYVYDSAWSPTHPSVFVTVDGSGCLTVFDLNSDTECCKYRVQVCSRPLNQVVFSMNGQHVICGGADGRVYLFDLATSEFQPGDDELLKFQTVMAGLVDSAISLEKSALHHVVGDLPKLPTTSSSSVAVI